METDRYGRRIALFGGSFDPVHIGHLVIASAAAAQFSLDEVVFVPARRSPLKPPCEATPSQRAAMLKLAIADEERCGLTEEELCRAEPSYTWDTVSAARRRDPDARIFLIVGEDAFAGLEQWRCAADIAREVTFLVAPRTGAAVAQPAIPVRAERIEMPRLEISSTLIRESVRRGAPIRYLVPEPVRDYIGREGLYGPRHPSGD